MKFFALLLIVLTSCSSIKRDREVINAFLEPELSQKKYDTLFVKEQPVRKEMLFYLYERAYNERLDFPSAIRKVGNHKFSLEWPFDSLKIAENKSKAEKNHNWISNDFTFPVVIAKGNLNTDTFVRPHLFSGNHILYVSRPVYTSDKKYAIFSCGASGISPGMGSLLLSETGIIVMYNNSNKWIPIAVIHDSSVN